MSRCGGNSSNAPPNSINSGERFVCISNTTNNSGQKSSILPFVPTYDVQQFNESTNRVVPLTQQYPHVTLMVCQHTGLTLSPSQMQEMLCPQMILYVHPCHSDDFSGFYYLGQGRDDGELFSLYDPPPPPLLVPFMFRKVCGCMVLFAKLYIVMKILL